MTIKGTLIATLAAGYIAAISPVSAQADDKAAAPAKAEGDKASCKGAGGCKGDKKAKGDKASCKGAGGCKGDKAHKDEKKEEKKAEKPAEEPKK
jgi:hypothetical protein